MASSNDPAPIDDPEFWQTPANEARAKAAAMTGAAAKAKMIAAAEHYEALIVRIKRPMAFVTHRQQPTSRVHREGAECPVPVLGALFEASQSAASLLIVRCY
jgi:hypothetical protein